MKHYGLEFYAEGERERFKEVCYQRLEERNMSIAELAEQIGYSPKSLYQFFSKNGDHIANKFLAGAIADKLKIERKEYRR